LFLLDLGSVESDDGVAALFARFVNGEFGAVDQVGDDIFAVEVRLGDRFDDSRTQRYLSGVPWRAQSAGGAAQLVGKVLRSGQRGVRQDEAERPRGVLHRSEEHTS